MSEINQRSKLYLLLMKREILYFQGYLFWYFFSKQYQRIGWWDRLLLIFFIPTSRRTLAKRLSRYVISLLCFFCPTDKSIVNYDTPLLSLASKCKMDKKFFTKNNQVSSLNVKRLSCDVLPCDVSNSPLSCKRS